MPTLPPNPYIVEDVPRKAYGNMVLSLIKMFSMTWRADEDVTDAYMLLALQYSAAITGDRLTGFYAAVWECAHFMNAALGPEAETIPIESADPTCEHETCRIANEAEFALIEAAFRGDGDAVQGICKAVVREARNPDGYPGVQRPEPEVALYMLWSGTLRRFFRSVTIAPDEG